jgi:hypothetical protein
MPKAGSESENIINAINDGMARRFSSFIEKLEELYKLQDMGP